MVVGAKVCELTDGFLWFVCGNFDGLDGAKKMQLHNTHVECVTSLKCISPK